MGSESQVILQTKLQPTFVSANLLHTERLLRRLTRLESVKLVLVHGEAGAGKSSLLFDHVRQASSPVAWYSLTPEDREPKAFLLYFLKALEVWHPALVMRTPLTFTIFLASRQTPDLPLAHLRGKGMLCEIGPDDEALCSSLSSWLGAALIHTGVDWDRGYDLIRQGHTGAFRTGDWNPRIPRRPIRRYPGTVSRPPQQQANAPFPRSRSAPRRNTPAAPPKALEQSDFA